MTRTIALLLLALMLLSGCAVLSPANELRLSEYDGNGSGGGLMTDFAGGAKGCRLVEIGSVTTCVTLRTEHCAASSCVLLDTYGDEPKLGGASDADIPH